MALKRANDWEGMDVTCLPPELHNRPERIPESVANAIREARQTHSRIFVAYADCGTGGMLDRVLEAEGIERLPGAHCYEFYATSAEFMALHDAEPGTFYLTDFLVRHYERLVTVGLGIDRHPQLAREYFRHYRRVVYLVQAADAGLSAQAAGIAARLGLEYEERRTGFGEMATSLADVMHRAGVEMVIEPPRSVRG